MGHVAHLSIPNSVEYSKLCGDEVNNTSPTHEWPLVSHALYSVVVDTLGALVVYQHVSLRVCHVTLSTIALLCH